jgi:hypothetical protein
MSVYLVIDWLVPKGHEAETDAALAAVRKHVATEHPEIRSVRVLRELPQDQAHCGYRWEEEYGCLADSEGVTLTEGCDELWMHVWHAAVPGSHRQSMWDDTDAPSEGLPGPDSPPA